MNYGQRLRLWRKRLRLMEMDVVRMIGIPRRSMQRLERNEGRLETWGSSVEALYRDVDARYKEGLGTVDTIRKVWE